MFCPDCGLQNRPGANFCATCGYSFKGKASRKALSGSGKDKKKRSRRKKEILASAPSSSVPASSPSPASPAVLGASPVSPAPVINAGPSGLLPVGALLDRRYYVREHVATGGMGAIYRGEDDRLKTTVAIKEMLDFFQTHEERKYATQRFREEALLLADLRHPNVPRVTDNFIEGGRYYLVMDFVRGKSTEKIIRDQGGAGLPVERVLRWAIQICDVLYYLHSRKPAVIYRDMKPSNVMIKDEDDDVMLVDFGIARHFVPRRPGTMIGTQGYAPPEQYKGRTEPRSDIYALAATLHHLLTGDDPTTGVPFQFKPVSHYRKDLPPDIDEIFKKALENHVELRYTNARQMQEAFKEAAGLLSAGGGSSRSSSYKIPSPPVTGGYVPPQIPSVPIPGPPSYDDRYRQRLRSDAQNRFLSAKNMAERGRFSKARRELEKILNLSPDFPEAHSLLGYVLTRLGRPRDAVDHLNRAVALKPGSATAHFYLGRAHASMGNFSQSQKEYQEAGRLDPAMFKKRKGQGFLERLINTLLS